MTSYSWNNSTNSGTDTIHVSTQGQFISTVEFNHMGVNLTCSTQDTINTTALCAPSVTISTESVSPFCEGEAVTFEVMYPDPESCDSDSITYEWSTGSMVATTEVVATQK